MLLDTLPSSFLERCRQILPAAEFPAFVESFTRPFYRAIRFQKDKYQAAFAENLSPSPFAERSFYTDINHRLNTDPLWQSGACYSQEPSAAAVINAVKDCRFNTILDLCAAPGGKSLQLHELLHKNGLLFCNELIHKRYRILCENMQRAGICNTFLCSCEPEKIAADFPSFFELVLVDAPCSGEGMFRKKPKTIPQWSAKGILDCAIRQQKILEAAILCLKTGGLLIYSTCTFNTIENEQNIDWLCRKYPQLKLLAMTRIWPHLAAGEGHFFAVLSLDRQEIKDYVPTKDTAVTKDIAVTKDTSLANSHKNLLKMPNIITDFFGMEYLQQFAYEYYYYQHKNHCFLLPNTLLKLKNKSFRSLIRTGLLLGEIIDGRKIIFKPAHAAATVCAAKYFPTSIDLSKEEFYSYICGEELKHISNKIDCPNKWKLCTYAGLGIGFVRLNHSRMQNCFPKNFQISSTYLKT